MSDALKSHETNVTQKRPLKKSISKSLDDLIKISDSTDDNVSEQANFDASSNHSKQSADEKRNLYAIKSQKQMTEYFSFNAQVIITANSGQSSRSSSPHLNSLDYNDSIRTSKSLYHITNKDSIDGSLDDQSSDTKSKPNSDSNDASDQGKCSLKSFDISDANSLTNKSFKTLDSTKTDTSMSEQPTMQKLIQAKERRPYETPLLTNLLHYNSVMMKATNSLTKGSNKNNDLAKPRSNSFNVFDLKN